MDKREKQLEVLNDTIKHYNATNRSQDANGRCTYAPSETSQGCAVGRLVKDKELCKKWGNEGIHSIFSQLPSELKVLGVDFLGDLQGLHDNKDYWNENGLSEKGGQMVSSIKRKYSLV